jgi:ribosomal protein L12E/L44/L45/RPP1/RPP2
MYKGNPTLFITASMGLSTICGVFLFTIIDRNQMEREQAILKRRDHQRMSENEARLRAMIETAENSTTEERLSNAVEAQEHFMLPGRGAARPKFADQIESRSREMLQEEEEKERKREIEKKTATRFWN